jgi:glycosyltransferase involved in cell wall biosynthesis
MTTSDYVLWLPSWYPNKMQPFDGDFIQRHAYATSLYEYITVCHFPQIGEYKKIEERSVEVRQSGKLKELIVFVSFRPTGIKFLDKILYNVKFYSAFKIFLKQYFRQFGLPKLVHVHVPIKAGNLAMWIKRKYKIEYLVSEHSSYYLKSAPQSVFKQSSLHRAQLQRILERAKGVTNVSTAVGIIIADVFHLPPVRTIYNTVNTDHFYCVEKRIDPFTFIHVSGLTEQKNIKGILQAFGKLINIRKDWCFKIVGPLAPEMQQLVNMLGLKSHVELTGELSYIDVAKQMQQCHAMVMFSRHENFPCAVIEALCCGLPVVSSDVAGVKEAINSSNGILVESENELQLIQALQNIHDCYNQYNCKRIAFEAFEKYSYSVIGQQFSSLYTLGIS